MGRKNCGTDVDYLSGYVNRQLDRGRTKSEVLAPSELKVINLEEIDGNNQEAPEAVEMSAATKP